MNDKLTRDPPLIGRSSLNTQPASNPGTGVCRARTALSLCKSEQPSGNPNGGNQGILSQARTRPRQPLAAEAFDYRSGRRRSFLAHSLLLLLMVRTRNIGARSAFEAILSDYRHRNAGSRRTTLLAPNPADGVSSLRSQRDSRKCYERGKCGRIKLVHGILH